MENVKVINIMADGSICEDLTTYIGPEHPLPELTVRLLREFIEQGYEELKQKGG